MHLESDKRLNIQLRLACSSAPTGEARQAGREDIESLSVANEPQRSADTRRIMEEVCERKNLKEALRQVRSNKGNAGVDGMTIDKLGDSHSGAIAERYLRTETGEAGGNPEAGRRGAKASHPNRAGPLCPASGDAGSAEAMELDVLPTQLRVSTA